MNPTLQSTERTAMNLRTLALASMFALASANAGCASFHVATPAGFAPIEDDDRYDYRATNADGVVVSVRVERNRPEANLDFWSQAVDDRLRARGYEIESPPRDVRSADGLQGRQYRYTATVGGRPHRYWVTVFVKEGGFLRHSKVFVLEAGGDQEIFDRAAPAVERVIAGFTT